MSEEETWCFFPTRQEGVVRFYVGIRGSWMFSRGPGWAFGIVEYWNDFRRIIFQVHVRRTDTRRVIFWNETLRNILWPLRPAWRQASRRLRGLAEFVRGHGPV